MTAAPPADTFVDRTLRGFTSEQADDVRDQAKAFGYSFEKRECRAIVVEEDDGNRRGAAIATLALLQARALASGLYGGRVGPVEFRAYEGAEWTSVWTDSPTNPYACRMTFVRKGLEQPQEFVGIWPELAKDDTHFRKQPCQSFARAVEERALRSLFRDILNDTCWPPEDWTPPKPRAKASKKGGA